MTPVVVLEGSERVLVRPGGHDAGPQPGAGAAGMGGSTREP